VVSSWRTLPEIIKALERYESNLDWQRPRLHGIGFAEGANEISFVRVNDDEDLLAAAVLATVTGWHHGPGSVKASSRKPSSASRPPRPARSSTLRTYESGVRSTTGPGLGSTSARAT
jgi:hypothetical protein